MRQTDAVLRRVGEECIVATPISEVEIKAVLHASGCRAAEDSQGQPAPLPRI